MSFNQGVFPEFLKVAKGIAIHKQGEKLNSNSYKTISPFPSISKLYEKSIQIQLNNFLRTNKMLFCYQLSFRINYSTNHALISLTEMIRNAIDTGNFAYGVFIPLQKTLTLSIIIYFFPN